MADNNHPTEWYLARDGRQHGPVTDAELEKIIELGYLKPTDLVWRQGMAEWALAEAVLDLSPRSAAPAPPRPTAPQPVSEVRDGRGAAGPQAAAAGFEQARPAPAAPVAGPGTQPAPTRPVQSAAYSAASRQAPHPQGFQQDLAVRHAPQVPAGAAPGPGPAPVGGLSAPVYPAGPAFAPRSGPAIAGPHPGAFRPAEKHELEPDEAVERRGFPWRTAVVLLLLGGLAAGGFALYRSGKLESLPFLTAPAVKGTLPVVARPGGTSRDAAQPASASLASSGGAASVDQTLQQSPLWQRLKRDFPDWYQEVSGEFGRLAGESRSEREISSAMTRALVELRRKHHTHALAASPARLKSIAASFVDNLARLSKESTAACYGYISQGEASSVLADLKKPEQRAGLEAQLATIFDAVVEGRRSPAQKEGPRREDYDALSQQLAKKGWSAADLQLFTDARALSRAAPEKVCQMVQDWFAAQLAVEDEAAKVRLLGETLKPVVAG